MSSFVPPSTPPVVVVEQPPSKPTAVQQQQVAVYWTAGLLAILPSLLFSFGAAKLSYDRFRSIGWAIVAFIFSAFYYPYYAFFVSGPAVTAPTGMLGAMRRAFR